MARVGAQRHRKNKEKYCGRHVPVFGGAREGQRTVKMQVLLISYMHFKFCRLNLA